jgi:glycosyltransferase involved in cell wall biosynthesis
MSHLISIIMPTFNSARFVGEALDSLDRQTNQNFELIICDGGSQDETLPIIAARMKDRARIVSRSDAGVPDALNKGFAAARGDVLCWHNSDDVLVSRHALERVARAFSDPATMIAIGDCSVLSIDGTVAKTLIVFAHAAQNPTSGGNLFTGSLFFRRAVWDHFGGFSGRFRLAFEYELTDTIFAAFPAVRIDELIGGFRIHESGLSSRYGIEMAEELAVLRKGLPRSSRALGLIRRVIQHTADRSLLRVLRNRLADPNRGLRWDEVELRGWVGSGRNARG